MPYVKEDAIEELKEKVNYKEYNGKHGESIFTKFFQNYYLPMKFGFDKRKPHLSSLIVSGQITREQALKEVDKPFYQSNELATEKEYIAKKLSLDLNEFERILKLPSHAYSDFKNMSKRYYYMKKIQTFFSKVLRKNLSNYS